MPLGALLSVTVFRSPDGDFAHCMFGPDLIKGIREVTAEDRSILLDLASKHTRREWLLYLVPVCVLMGSILGGVALVAALGEVPAEWLGVFLMVGLVALFSGPFWFVYALRAGKRARLLRQAANEEFFLAFGLPRFGWYPVMVSWPSKIMVSDPLPPLEQPYAHLSSMHWQHQLTEYQEFLLDSQHEDAGPIQRSLSELERSEIRGLAASLPTFSIWDIVIVAMSGNLANVLARIPSGETTGAAPAPWGWITVVVVVIVMALLGRHRWHYVRLRRLYERDADEGIVLVERDEAGVTIEYLPHSGMLWNQAFAETSNEEHEEADQEGQ